MELARCLILLLLMLGIDTCRAQGVVDSLGSADGLQNAQEMKIPTLKRTKIEVVYELDDPDKASKYHKLEFMLVDAYTDDEEKIVSAREGDKVFALTFNLRHPLYDMLKENGRLIPFYVEPGDYLVITIKEDGTRRYKMADGSECRWKTMLMHDVSNETYYDESMFDADKQNATFKGFVDRVVERMDSAVTQVVSVANREKFSTEEKDVSISNVKMQFALWLMEYASWKTVQLGLYAKKQQAGWQSLPEHEAEMAALEDVKSYSFMRRLPMNDESCLSSRFFPLFLQSYQHSHVLNHDQYLYFGDMVKDHAKMDSVLQAREKAITGMSSASVFMDVIMTKRKMARDEAAKRIMLAKKENVADTTQSIKLEEVEVWSQKRIAKATQLSENEKLLVKLNNAPTGFNILAPIFWLVDKYLLQPMHKKKPTAKEKAKVLVQQYGEEDDKLQEAYEKMRKEKGK